MTQQQGSSAEAPVASASWEALIDGLQRFVARRIPASEVEDVVQDIALRLHRDAASLRDEARVEAWVFGIARRAIADFFRQRQRRPLELADGGLDSTDDGSLESLVLAGLTGLVGSPHDSSVHEEVLSWLRPMVDDLPERYREAILWADFEGLPQREVARRLGLSLPGAKSRVQRARKLMGQALHDCCTVEFGPDGKAVDFIRRRCAC